MTPKSYYQRRTLEEGGCGIERCLKENARSCGGRRRQSESGRRSEKETKRVRATVVEEKRLRNESGEWWMVNDSIAMLRRSGTRRSRQYQRMGLLICWTRTQTDIRSVPLEWWRGARSETRRLTNCTCPAICWPLLFHILVFLSLHIHVPVTCAQNPGLLVNPHKSYMLTANVCEHPPASSKVQQPDCRSTIRQSGIFLICWP